MAPKKHVCDCCNRLVHGVRKRPNGRRLCWSCNRDRVEYGKHWAVRSLKYHAPDLPALKARKPFKGQMELFPVTEEPQTA